MHIVALPGFSSCYFLFFNSPNSGYTEGVLTVSVKAGVRSGYALWARGFVCAGMPF